MAALGALVGFTYLFDGFRPIFSQPLSRRDPLTISWHRFNRELDAHLDRSILAA
jgi:hypothetical protein